MKNPGTGQSDRLTIKLVQAAAARITRSKHSNHDGRTMYNSDVAQFVQAMSAFAPPSATQTSWVMGSKVMGVLLAVSH
jgi:hypothetical protein